MNESIINKVVRILSKLFNIRTLIFLGALLLMLSFFLGWIDQPILGWLKGKELRLSQNLPPIISYGSLCLVLGLCSLLSLFNRLRWTSFFIGLTGLIVSLHFLLSFCVLNSKKIVAINDFNQQEKQILFFHKYLPPNAGIEPTFNKSIDIDTISERFSATFHFATFGWYASVLGSVFLLIAYAKAPINRTLKKISFFILIFSILLYLSLVLPPYVVAELHRNKGDYYLSEGMYTKAMNEYETALRLDLNMDYLKSLHINMGKAYFFTGRSDKADYYIYKATIYSVENDLPMAIFYLQRAIVIEPPIRETVGNNFIGWTYVDDGLSKYKSGNVAFAIELWKKSLEMDPSQVQAYYYLSRAYYEISAYEESIMAGLRFLELSKDKILRANASSNIGDSFYRLKDYSSARAYYIRSMLLDNFGNLRAIMSLVGK